MKLNLLVYFIIQISFINHKLFCQEFHNKDSTAHVVVAYPVEQVYNKMDSIITSNAKNNLTIAYPKVTPPSPVKPKLVTPTNKTKNSGAKSLTGAKTNSVNSSNVLLQQDSLALVSLYNSTNGPAWYYKTNWLVGPLNTWIGVTVTNGRVVGLNVGNNNLSGAIDATLNLSALTTLYVFNNGLTALDISNLPLLEILYAYGNKLTQFTKNNTPNYYSKLYDFKIYQNLLSGLDISNMPALKTCWVGHGKVIGDINTNFTQFTFNKTPGYYYQIKSLGMNYTGLTNLDLSKGMENLSDLYIGATQIKSFDLTGLNSLKSFFGENSMLNTLNLSAASTLTDLEVYNSKLTSLDISNLPVLETLHVYGNQLTSFTKNNTPNYYSKLTDLKIYQNQLSGFDISNMPALKFCWVGHGKVLGDINTNFTQFTINKSVGYYYQIESLGMNYSGLTSVDLSKGMENLSDLYIGGTSIKSFDFTGLTSLKTFYGERSALTTLNLNPASSLTDLEVYNSKLTTLDISNLPLLETLYVYGNQLTSFTKNNSPNYYSKLTDLKIYQNQLSGFDISNMPALKTCWVGHGKVLGDINTNFTQFTFNKTTGYYYQIQSLGMNYSGLTNLDLSKGMENLSDLYIGGTSIKSFDFTGLTSLKTFYGENSALTTLNLNPASSLTDLEVYNSKLTTLDISNLPLLETLYIYGNQLTTFTKNNTPDYYSKLSDFKIYQNQLSGLDISNMPALKVCWMGHRSFLTEVNQNFTQFTFNKRAGYYYQIQSLGMNYTGLTDLDLSTGMENLSDLYVNYSSIKSLNISGLNSLKNLYVDNAKLTFKDLEPLATRSFTTYQYAPQSDLDLYLNNLTLSAKAGGAHNLYQWQKNGVNIPGATSPTLTVSQADFDANNQYQCFITNTLVTGLTLKTVLKRIKDQFPTPPQLSAGVDKILTLPVNYTTLSAIGIDIDPTITSVLWSKTSGGNVILSGETTSTLNLYSLAYGSYIFRVTATHNDGSQTYDELTVTVKGEIVIGTPAPFSYTPNYSGTISAIKWGQKYTASDTREKVYAFDYDKHNRLKNAYYAEKGVLDWNHAKGNFNEEGIQYDLNGNLLTLKRFESGQSENRLMDSLSYKYEGNKLQVVNDGASNPIDYPNGFDNHGTQTDVSNPAYLYDDNGNLTEDHYKNLKITYNLLNLPEKVDFGNSNYIKYVYDATGVKLAKKIFSNDTLTRTIYYDGNLTLENSKVTSVATSEGRVVPSTKPGEAGLFNYEYFIRDHLGNVRLALTAAEPDVFEYLATMESENDAVESKEFKDIPQTRQVDPLYNHTSGGNESSRLNGAQGRIVGPAITLKVVPGDTVTMEVYAKYLDNGNNYKPLISSMASTLANVYTGGMAEASKQIVTNAFNSLPPLVLTNSENVPRAYLNYILFDKNFGYVSSGSGFKQISSTAKTQFELLKLQTPVNQEGYLYIYVANETAADVNVFFDDLKVTQKEGPILSRNDYYPFGLSMDKSSYQSASTNPNKYLFNSKEQEDDAFNGISLETYDFGARHYTPALGRWFSPDVFSGSFSSVTPYNFTLNDPINLIDPDGNYPMDNGYGSGYPMEYAEAQVAQQAERAEAAVWSEINTMSYAYNDYESYAYMAEQDALFNRLEYNQIRDQYRLDDLDRTRNLDNAKRYSTHEFDKQDVIDALWGGTPIGAGVNAYNAFAKGDYLGGALSAIIAASPFAAGLGELGMVEEVQGLNVAKGVKVVGSNFNEILPTQDWINYTKVSEYKSLLQSGQKLAPIDAYRQGNNIYIEDGHHRFAAYKELGITPNIIIRNTGGPIGFQNWLNTTFQTPPSGY